MTADVFSFEPGDPYAGELRSLAKRTATESVLAACPRLIARLPEILLEPCQSTVERAVALREALREVLRAAYPLAVQRDRVASDVLAGGAIVGLVSEPRWSGVSPDQMRQVAMSKRARQLVAATWLGSGNVTTERGMHTYEELSLNALRLALFAFLRDAVAVRQLALRLRGSAPAPRPADDGLPPQQEVLPADPREDVSEGVGKDEDVGEDVRGDLAPEATEAAAADRCHGFRRRLDTLATMLVVLGTVIGLVVLLRPEVVTDWSRAAAGVLGARPAVLADLSSDPWVYCHPRESDCGYALITVEWRWDGAGACVDRLAVLYESALWRSIQRQHALERLMTALLQAADCSGSSGP